MQLIKPKKAEAYLNHGRWLADCPSDACNSAMDVEPGQPSFLCGWHALDPRGRPELRGGCGTAADLVWPKDAVELVTALALRDVENRNWAPHKHRQTYVSYTRDGLLIADAYPGGQSVKDLYSESAGAK